MSGLLGRAIAALALTLAVVILLTCAAGFLIAALYMAVAAETSPTEAALACGGVLLLIAILVGLVARFTLAPRRRAPARTAAAPAASPTGLAGEVGLIVGETARTSLRAHAPQAILAALAAGFAVGVSPRLRRTLLRLLD